MLKRTLAHVKTEFVKPTRDGDEGMPLPLSSTQPTAPVSAEVSTAAPLPPAGIGLEENSIPDAGGTDAGGGGGGTDVTASSGFVSGSTNKDYCQVLDVFLKCGAHLDMIATKFTVTVEACASHGSSDSAWASSLCKSVDASCENLVSSCLVASACSCGVFLRKQVLKSGEVLVSALEAQLKCAVLRMQHGTKASDNLKKQLTVLTGQVTAACNQLKRIPRSNRGYFKRIIMESYKQSLDIANEQKEIVEDSEGSPRVDDAEAEEGSGSDPFEDDILDYDFSLSAIEIVRSRQCIALIVNSSSFLKTVAKAVGSGMKNDASSQDAVTAVDKACYMANHFSTVLNELGVSLCPPQESASVRANVDDLLTSACALSGALHTILRVAETGMANVEGEHTGVDLTLLQNVDVELARLTETAAEIKHTLE